MSPVTIEKTIDIAFVRVDNPPVNALSYDVRSGLMDAIQATENDANIRAVVLVCKGRTFIAGADVREFNQPPREPHLPDVIHALEQTTKPWIAAIHGTALGGGLEVTLGCDYRLAVSSAKLGLPEVNLGLIPGAGGTVRMPRLVSPEEAVSMIASGKPMSAAKAKEIGLADQIVDGDLEAAAIEFAKSGISKQTPISKREAKQPASQEAWDKLKASLVKKARGQNSISNAVEAVERAITMNADEAFAAERTSFIALKEDTQSKALRHIFFAERSATRMPELKDVKPNELKSIGVIGGGTMGAGIAAACLLSGFSAVMIERDNAAVDAGKSRITSILDGSLKRGLISAEKHKAMIAALTCDTDYAALSDCDLVIEAVFEDMDVKHEVFAKLDAAVKPGAILASNTSYLNVNEIAQASQNPSRVIGLHFFSPAHIMKLLEIIVTDKAAPEVLATAFIFGKTLRKITVPSAVCDGFIGNRIMSSYRKEVDYMLQDGALPADIDGAMRDFGFPMGIFEMQDLAGLDIGWANRKRLAPSRNPNERYVTIADTLCEIGRFGRKTGKGWYIYDENNKATTDPEVIKIIEDNSADAGIVRQAFSADEIMDRIMTAMRAESQKVLDEKIAASPEAIDVVMVNGYSFPRYRGGPMFGGHNSG